MNLFNRYHERHTINLKWDMLDHYMCFSNFERKMRSANYFFTETIEEIDQEYGEISVPMCARAYAEELGLQHRITNEKPTLWVNYWHIYQLINPTHNDAQHPHRARMRKLLASILDAPSTELTDVQKIYYELNDFIRTIIGTSYYQKDADFYREMFNIIFTDLLPFKFRAYNMALTSDSGVVHIEAVKLSTENYLEMLFQMFFYTSQSIRGKSLVDIRSSFNDLTVYIYLIMQTIFPNHPSIWEKTEIWNILCLFRSYLDLEIQGGIGDHITSRVDDLLRDSADWFEITKNLKDRSELLESLITDENHRRVSEIRDTWYVGPVDFDHSDTVFIGDSYYKSEEFLKTGDSADNLELKYMLYVVEQVEYPLIRLYLKMINENSLSFTIDENRMGYLKSHKIGDIGKITYLNNPHRSRRNSKVVLHLPEEDEIFVLFTVKESDDLYGIGIHENNDGTRKLIRFETSKSDYTYSFVLGGDEK